MARGSRFDGSLTEKNKAIPDIVALDLEFPKWRPKAIGESWREEKTEVKQKRQKGEKGLWERGCAVPSGVEPSEPTSCSLPRGSRRLAEPSAVLLNVCQCCRSLSQELSVY